MDLPDGFVQSPVQGSVVVARREAFERVRDAIEMAGSLPRWAAAQDPARRLEGRGTAWCVEGSAGEDWVIRHYRRGGAMAWLLGDRYLRLGVRRPFHELHVSQEARVRGVATPAVVAAVVHDAGLFYSADLVTVHIPDSADLAAVTFESPGREPAERIAAWRAAGELVRHAAEEGLRHVDLNLKNILIGGMGAPVPRAWLIDLDRARIGRPLPVAGRNAMVARLHRSREKLERKFGRTVPRAELDAFDDGLRG